MIRRKAATLVILVFVLQCVLPPLSSLALVEPYDLPRLTLEASQIVWGQVLDVASHWDAERTYISSTVTLSSSQYLKGEGANKLTLKVPGGVVGDVGQWVEDAPTFSTGEEVVLFLADDGTRVLGSSQGKFTCVDGRVLEANMMPVYQFVTLIQTTLQEQGYVMPQSAAIKGKAEGHSLEAVSVKLDTGGAPFPQVAATESVATTDSLALSESALQPTAWQTIKSEDFEGAFPNSWVLYGNPTWGTTDYRVRSGSNSNYCVALGSAGEEAPGPYPAGTTSWMVYGPFSLVDATDADVQFWHWTKAEKDYDYFQVLASVDGVDYSGVQFTGDWSTAQGNVNGWMAGELDLASVYSLGNLCGQSQVWIAFAFTSDGGSQDEGTYLDDVVIRKNLGASAPTITSVTPTARPAGIGAQATLAGTDLGVSQGTGSVAFWVRASTWVTATIVSWSDTKIVCQVPAQASSHATQAIRLKTSNGTAYAGFTIKWSYMGIKWPGDPVLIKYYIGAGTSDCSGENTAVKQGANAWAVVDATYHALKFWGTTTRNAPVRDG